MADIFISYRREDTRADAGRLYDRLSGHFGDDHVFMDIEDIAPGENFVEILDKTLEACGVLIALIGRRWLAAGDDRAANRLNDPEDFVRLEIDRALHRGIRVIPVLVGGAEIPDPSQLPASVSALASIQALEIDDGRFHQDVDLLIATLVESGATQQPATKSRGRRWAAAFGIVAALVTVVVWMLHEQSGTRLRHQPAELSVDQAKVMLVEKGLHDASWNSAGQGVVNRYETRDAGGDVVVADRTTRLMWQMGGSPLQMAYAETTRYVRGLNERRHAGFDDWRLPTLEEAASLIQPATDAQGYTHPLVDGPATPVVWTSDRGPNDTDWRWATWLADGTSRPERASFHAWVKVVRGPD
jgi:hypothetical protein